MKRVIIYHETAEYKVLPDGDVFIVIEKLTGKIVERSKLLGRVEEWILMHTLLI